MDWAFFVTQMIAAIQQCQADRNAARRRVGRRTTLAQIEAGLRRPGIFERFALRAMLRDDGFEGRDLAAKVSEGMAELRALASDDITAIMTEAAKPMATVA